LPAKINGDRPTIRGLYCLVTGRGQCAPEPRKDRLTKAESETQGRRRARNARWLIGANGLIDKIGRLHIDINALYGVEPRDSAPNLTLPDTRVAGSAGMTTRERWRVTSERPDSQPST
jgi:hypothetical protein